MDTVARVISRVDELVWGPVMLFLLVGTGIYLTFRLGFAPWRNLGYALKMTLSRESRTKNRGQGDISPFSALMTALASTIGTGNIVGVATAMVSGGPGALVWMWLSAVFGLSSKFSECMLAIKYREINEKNEMSGGPMYTMKKAFKNKKAGAALGFMFAFFAVIASFGIGNMTQANSIAEALFSTFSIPAKLTGLVLTFLALIIIVGGIKSISKVSSVLVPLMALFYMACGVIVILGNIKEIPQGLSMIFQMAFSPQAVGGGLCGTITASMLNGMRYGVARGVFSNEAGMGSAAISAAAATTDYPVRQGYISMTGTFWDTLVVCTITGLCIASSGVLGTATPNIRGAYVENGTSISVQAKNLEGKDVSQTYECKLKGNTVILLKDGIDKEPLTLYAMDSNGKNLNADEVRTKMQGNWSDAAGNHYHFRTGGVYEQEAVVKGAMLTILAFQTVLGETGGVLVCIGIALFAFSTIIGWEYHGEKAFEYLLRTRKYNMLYRILFSGMAYVGATTALDVVWNFSDIANALMAIPNLICLLALSGEIAKDVKEFQKVIDQEHREKPGKNA